MTAPPLHSHSLRPAHGSLGASALVLAPRGAARHGGGRARTGRGTAVLAPLPAVGRAPARRAWLRCLCGVFHREVTEFAGFGMGRGGLGSRVACVAVEVDRAHAEVVASDSFGPILADQQRPALLLMASLLRLAVGGCGFAGLRSGYARVGLGTLHGECAYPLGEMVGVGRDGAPLGARCGAAVVVVVVALPVMGRTSFVCQDAGTFTTPQDGSYVVTPDRTRSTSPWLRPG